MWFEKANHEFEKNRKQNNVNFYKYGIRDATIRMILLKIQI